MKVATLICGALVIATALSKECGISRKTQSWVPGAQVIESENFSGSSSPTWPTYSANLNCTFTIEVPAGSKIFLRFKRFELEYHPFCEYDSLTLYDGADSSAPLIGSFCGIERPLPPAFISATNKLTLRFKTDGSGGAEGFQFWAFERKGSSLPGCGGVLTGDFGTITSPAQPSGVDCVWNIQLPDSNKVISLEVEDYNIPQDEGILQCAFDGLEVLDGKDQNDFFKLTDNLCGRLQAGHDTPLRVTSSSNSLRIRFYTSAVSTASFRLKYTAAPRTCGGSLTAAGSDVIPSPVAVAGARACRWSVTADDASQYLKFSNMAFTGSSDCNENYVIFRDHELQSTFASGEMQKHERRICNSGSITKDVFSDSSSLDIFMKVEGVTHPATTFTTTYEQTACSKVLTAKDGIIRSPGYPNAYPDNMDCVININFAEHERIVLNFNQLDMEPSKDCQYDYIEVHDGDSLNAPSIAKLCGSKREFKTAHSSSNNLTLHFVSNSHTSGHGFEITYTKPLSRCGGQLTDSYGTFFNPPNLDGQDYFYCIWRIDLPVGMKVNLTFSELFLQAPTNNNDPQITGGDNLGEIEVRDGGDERSTLIGKYTNTIPEPIVSSGNQLYVLLHKLDLGGLLPNARVTGHYTAVHSTYQPKQPFDYIYNRWINGEQPSSSG